MHTTLNKYRHIVFVLLLASYLFSVFQYLSVKIVYTLSYLSELNDFSHYQSGKHQHEHKLLTEKEITEKDHSDQQPFIVELQERIEIIDVVILDDNISSEERPLDNFHYTNLKELYILKSIVPPPQSKG